MATRCTAEQLAEAVTIWSIETNFNQWQFSEIEDTNGLTPLDLFLSTVSIFLDSFTEKLETECDDYKQGILLSKQNFIDHLKHHCCLLAESNGCFDLILTCAFVSHEVYKITFYFQCFHFSRVAYKLLAKFLEYRFGDMFNTDSGWEELMAYCRKIHSAVLPSRENRPPDYDTDDESTEYVEDPNIQYRTFRKEPEVKDLSRDDRQIHQEGIDNSDRDANQLFGQSVSKEIKDGKFLLSKEDVHASEDQYSNVDNKSRKGNQNSQKDLNIEQGVLESEFAKADVKSIEMTKETETDSSDIGDLSSDEGSDDGYRNYETTGDIKKLEIRKNIRNYMKKIERRYEKLELKNQKYKATLTDNDISNKRTEEILSESSVTSGSSNDESLADDSVYWQYETMKRSVLRKRITDSEEHLRDVLNRLAMIKRKVDPDIIPSNEYNIPISDDEDIQDLEKCEMKPNFSEWQIALEEEDVECIKKEICDQKNEKLDELSEKRVSPEDITDGEIFQNVIDIFDPSDDEDQCEICDGRTLPFKNKWIEDFHRKFPGNVSGFLIPVTPTSYHENL